MRSKLEERIRKSQAAKKVDTENLKVVNAEELKQSAAARLEEDHGIVLHSRWAAK